MGKWRKHLESLGLEAPKELRNYAFLCLPFLAGIALVWIFLGVSTYLALPPLAWFAFTYLYFSRYGRMVARKEAGLVDEFVTLFTFFGIYVEDGANVYASLTQIRDYASPEMKERLGKLLHDMEIDKTVAPFVDFASLFPDIAIKQVMLSIYQIVDEGQGGVYVAQFGRLFGKLSEQKHQAQKEKREERLSMLGFLPLVGSGIAMVTLSLSMLTVMEDMMNVL